LFSELHLMLGWWPTVACTAQCTDGSNVVLTPRGKPFAEESEVQVASLLGPPMLGSRQSSRASSTEDIESDVAPSAGDASSSKTKEANAEMLPILRGVAGAVARELCEEIHHELCISQAEEPVACCSSTTLSNLWGRFFQASENLVFRAVAHEVSPESTGHARRFIADLVRTEKHQRFGVECTDCNGSDGVLIITGIERGSAVEKWNNYCASMKMPWKRLHLCAAILSVNGVSGDTIGMKRALSASLRVVVAACNPPTLCDALSVLRVVRAAAPPSPGEPFWASAVRQYNAHEDFDSSTPRSARPRGEVVSQC